MFINNLNSSFILYKTLKLGASTYYLKGCDNLKVLQEDLNELIEVCEKMGYSEKYCENLLHKAIQNILSDMKAKY